MSNVRTKTKCTLIASIRPKKVKLSKLKHKTKVEHNQSKKSHQNSINLIWRMNLMCSCFSIGSIHRSYRGHLSLIFLSFYLKTKLKTIPLPNTCRYYLSNENPTDEHLRSPTKLYALHQCCLSNAKLSSTKQKKSTEEKKNNKNDHSVFESQRKSIDWLSVLAV